MMALMSRAQVPQPLLTGGLGDTCCVYVRISASVLRISSQCRDSGNQFACLLGSSSMVWPSTCSAAHMSATKRLHWQFEWVETTNSAQPHRHRSR